MKMKSLLNGKEYETLKDENVKLTKENEQLKRKVLKLTKENEILCEKLVETNENALKLTEKYERLNRRNAMAEKANEILTTYYNKTKKYFNIIKSRLNNQVDDDTKLYSVYHTHDTFKVHNKLAEVVSVLVDEDDVVHGYEIKFEDSDDIFFMYPEEIED